MKKSVVVGIVVLAVLLPMVLGGVYFKRLGIRKHEIGLVNRYEAQENVVETTLFRMRSTIKNMHGCTDEWADKFILVVAEQAKGRSGMSGRANGGGAGEAIAGVTAAGGGSGFTFARESEALGLPPDLYMKLSNAIEGQIADFTRQQNVLTDVWRVHKTYCEDPAINEFWKVPLLAKVKEKPVMITSAETKDAMKTKQVDEALF